MRRDRGIVVALLMGGFVVRGALAQAQPEGGVGDAPAKLPGRAVDVTILAGGGEADPLMDTIRELFGRLGLAVHAHFVATLEEAQDAGSPPAGMSVRIDLGSRYEALLVVRNDLVEVRRTISRDASPAIVREEIADAVRSAVDSQLLRDEARTAPPAPAIVSSAPIASPPPVVVEAPAPRPESRSFALDLTAFAGAGPIASGSTLSWVGARVGGGLVLGLRRGRRPSLTITASYLVPFDSAAANTRVKSNTDIVSIRAVPALEIVHASWIALDVGVGGGVDVITLRPTALAPFQAANSTSEPDPIATALARVEVGLAPSVAFTLVVGSDFDFASRHYFVQTTGREDLLVPSPVRPLALAGFTFTAVGTGLFAARSAP
jgi:hypothetical protein